MNQQTNQASKNNQTNQTYDQNTQNKYTYYTCLQKQRFCLGVGYSGIANQTFEIMLNITRIFAEVAEKQSEHK